MNPEPEFHSFERAQGEAGAPHDQPPVDDITPSSAEVVEDVNTFEDSLSEEWQSTRSAYQQRISSIMDDFLHKGLEGEKREERPTAKPRRPSPSRENVEVFFGRMAEEMHAYENRVKAAAAAAPLALPAPVPKPKRGWILGVLGVILVVSAVAGFWKHEQIASYTPLPYARAGAVAVFDGKIYIADWLRKSLYVHAAKRGAPILAVESLPAGLSTGLIVDAEGIWTSDGITSEIVRHAKTPDHSPVSKFPAPGNRPAGLAEDRGSLWTASAEADKLFRVRGDDPSEVLEKFSLPGVNITALQLKDRRLWVLDGKSREVDVFRVQKDLKPLATLDLDPFLHGGTPTGLALQGSYAWIITENPAAILRIPLRSLKKSRQSEF